MSRRGGGEQDLAAPLISRARVAALLGVSARTVTRWAREGRLASQVTLGGHYRFDRELVEQIRRACTGGDVGLAN